MKKFIPGFVLSISLLLFMNYSLRANENGSEVKNQIHDIKVIDINGEEVSMSVYKGKVLLIVNVASNCGYTPQYEALQSLYVKYKEKGFEVLGFPCNDFGAQEPGTNKEIREFCSINYGVTFPLFNKIKITGKDKSQLFERLINSPAIENGEVKWNFEKFLISKEGKVVKRFRSAVKPLSEEVIKAVEEEIKKSTKR